MSLVELASSSQAYGVPSQVYWELPGIPYNGTECYQAGVPNLLALPSHLPDLPVLPMLPGSTMPTASCYWGYPPPVGLTVCRGGWSGTNMKNFKGGKRKNRFQKVGQIKTKRGLDGNRRQHDFYDIRRRAEAGWHSAMDALISRLRSNSALHVTRSIKSESSILERHHTRTLLTPVGSPLNLFDCTKFLVHALRNAIRHHQIAFEAGRGGWLKGFLLDWDCAEFTPEGLAKFNAEFPDRAQDNSQYPPIDKSLKYFIGTFPFMAIELIKDSETMHAAHHDLESVYWLLIWMILRHTDRQHLHGNLMCSRLFDHPTGGAKLGWIHENQFPSKVDPLFQLAEELRHHVLRQNPPKGVWDIVPDALTHKKLLDIFDKHLGGNNWPTADVALVFKVPSLDSNKNETKPQGRSKDTSQQTGGRPKRSKKRSRAQADLDTTHTSADSAGTTAVSSNASVARTPKRKKISHREAKDEHGN
ncbi:hypothetical protein B0H12DRAFT_1226117 [Mycena haematopus]|nr:hypothetical protein B0H12DRAFT_1226117 [Mycena haematopus]